MANESGVDLQTLRSGEYFAEAGDNQMSNIPGMDLPPPGGRSGFDANAALKTGRMFRTRAQEQDLQRIAKAQDRLMAQRSRMDKLAMTQQGRSRAEAMERAPAEREARLEAKNQRDLQQIRASKVEPAEAKGRADVEMTRLEVAQKQEADKAKTALGLATLASEEGREAIKQSATTQRTMIETAEDRRQFEAGGGNVDSPEYVIKEQDKLKAIAAKAESEGRVDEALEAQKLMGDLMVARYKKQLDTATDGNIPPVPAADGSTPPPTQTTPLQTTPDAGPADLNKDNKVSPDEANYDWMATQLEREDLKPHQRDRLKAAFAAMKKRLNL